jgi:glutamate 5-kinase
MPKDSLLYKRVIVKAGTRLLTSGSTSLNVDVLDSIARQIAQIRVSGAEVLLVSSGAVAAGRQTFASNDLYDSIANRQTLAAIGQPKLMNTYSTLFNNLGIEVAQALVSHRDMIDRLSYLNVRNTLSSLLAYKVIPILNENDVVAVDELSGEFAGDNDRLAALIANVIEADLLLLLGDVPGLYTADPNLMPDATLIPIIDSIDPRIEEIAKGTVTSEGTGGMTSKIAAAKLATAAGATVIIADGNVEDVILKIESGDSIGSKFLASATKLESRKRWMLGNMSSAYFVTIDEGALSALLESGRSLLPAGITAIAGEFNRGDIIRILTESGNHIAGGIANYASAELAKISGQHSKNITPILGYSYGDEAVHRDNLVLV